MELSLTFKDYHCGDNLKYVPPPRFKKVMAAHCNSDNKSVAVPSERWERATEGKIKPEKEDDWLLIRQQDEVDW